MKSIPDWSAQAFARVAAALVAIVLLAPGTGALAANAAADEAGVTRATLANGLRVVIVRNTLAPVVSTNVNYLVGADETPPGFPGTAHAQEHMMFRGSPGLSGDQLANIGSMMGGNFNAQTRQTVTQYFYTVPAEDLDAALHIEALRMRDVLDSKEDWEHERGAIEQEVAQDLSSPEYVLYTKLRAALFDGSTYAHDALGTRASFDATTAAMLKGFHDRWYVPNNAILVIVGNVDPQATLAKVERLFGPIPAKTLPARPAVALAPVAPQSLHLDSDLPYGLQVIALRLPGLESADFAAAEVLVDVLNSQRGDLYGLVPQGKALDASFSFDPLPKAGLGYAQAAFPEGSDPKALESAMRAVLEKIAKQGVPADLVAAAKLQERSSAEFQKNSIGGLATVWSEAVAVAGLESPDDDLARIEKVTVDDVNRVARKYLDLDHAVTAVLTPQGAGKPVASRGFGGQENISLSATGPTPLPEWAAAALGRVSVPESTTHPVVSKLANGITLIVQPENVSDTVSVYGHIRNRPELQVPKGKEGLSEVLAQLFPYGSQRLDRVALRQALDAIGADEHAGSDFALQTLAGNFERGTELLADNLLHPGFPEQAFKVVKRQVAQTVAGQLTSPSYLSARALRGALFPKHDPTLREPLPETVNAIAMKDVRDYYKAVFRPDLTTIVVIGKVTPQQAKTVIEKYFGAWAATGPAPSTVLPPVPLNAPAASAVPDASRAQDRVTLAETLGLTRSNPDYYALELGNNVLGGAFYSTRLTRDIRKDAGLVYYVQSHFQFSRTRGIYSVEYACDPQNVTKVHDMVAEELRRMQKAPVAADELQRAKALLLRQIPLDEASVDDIAQGFIQRLDLGLPLDEPTIAARRFLALGAGDVQAAFVKWLRPGDLVRVSQGPAPR
ncbi:MAG: insulinase family protein [Burkholderiales bacterium]|nr:insulinase family protein [Burkholderiales bacterium]